MTDERPYSPGLEGVVAAESAPAISPTTIQPTMSISSIARR